jgi:hypothetical protein
MDIIDGGKFGVSHPQHRDGLPPAFNAASCAYASMPVAKPLTIEKP